MVIRYFKYYSNALIPSTDNDLNAEWMEMKWIEWERKEKECIQQ